MPVAELIGPNRLNIGGHVFINGEPEEVDMETAFQLRDNPRFKVTGLDTREAVVFKESQRRPSGAALYAAILEAQDQLDLDDDEAFDRHGRPSIAALTRILGYPISRDERDAALKAASKVAHGEEGKAERVSPAEIAQHAAARGEPKPITIKRQNPSAPKETVADEQGVTV